MKAYQVTVSGTHFAGIVRASSKKEARREFLKEYQYKGTANLRVLELH